MAKKVADLMTHEVFSVSPRDDLSAVSYLMFDHDVRHVPVVEEDDTLVGLVSQRDLLRHTLIEGGGAGRRSLEETALEKISVREVMTDPESVEEDTPLREAALVMLENKFGCLPVVSGDKLVGILTESDFVRAAAEED